VNCWQFLLVGMTPYLSLRNSAAFFLSSVLEILLNSHSSVRGAFISKHILRVLLPYFSTVSYDQDCRPKSLPDYESAGAVWAPLSAITGFSNGGKDDAKSRRDSGPPVYKAAGSPGSVRGRRVQLRGDEPIKYCPHVAFGGDILPLAIPEEYAAAFRDVPF